MEKMIPSLAVHLVMRSRPSKRLQTFPNPAPGRDYRIHMEIPEFTCVCPMTGQPDFGTLLLEYVPDRTCVELKSLKLYIWSYRDQGAFHEAVTNAILDDLVAATKPRYLRLEARFNVDRKSTRLNSSHSQISYAVFCLKKKEAEHEQTPKMPHDH